MDENPPPRSDPRMTGFLLALHREGETAEPWLEAEAIARGLAYRFHGKMYLSPEGRRWLRGDHML